MATKGKSYALAVYLFAPMAVIVPMTISIAVGANTLVGEKEKGTGEFLAHSPASEREIYLGKPIASLLPGFLTTMIGFAAYSLVVNLIVGPHVGGWFFPTPAWWVLMLWVVPPFLAITLSVVLRLSARVKSAAAAQQASGLVTLPLIMLSYAQSTGGLGAGNAGSSSARPPGRSPSSGSCGAPAPSPAPGCWASTPAAGNRRQLTARRIYWAGRVASTAPAVLTSESSAPVSP